MAILGDMRELGQYTESAHRAVGKLLADRADRLITVGPAAKFIADAALPMLGPERILSFDTALQAKEKIRDIIEARDIILVKGSQFVRLEKIVEEIMLEPERKKDLLARQYGKWLIT